MIDNAELGHHCHRVISRQNVGFSSVSQYIRIFSGMPDQVPGRIEKVNKLFLELIWISDIGHFIHR